MALLDSGLARAGRPSLRRGVTLEDLGAYRSAFVSNSQGVAPVHRIDHTTFAVDEELMGLLTRAYADAPCERV